MRTPLVNRQNYHQDGNHMVARFISYLSAYSPLRQASSPNFTTGTTWAWCTWHQKPLTHIFPSFCTTIPEKTLFIMVGKLHKPVILKSYFIVSSNMTGNDHKMINHYVTDLDVTGKRNIIRDCNITPVSKNYPCVLLHCVMLHGWVTLANDLILCLRFLLYWYTQVMSSIPAATGAIHTTGWGDDSCCLMAVNSLRPSDAYMHH